MNLLVTQLHVLVHVLPYQRRVRLRMKGGQCGDSGYEHAHGVSVVAEGRDGLLQVLVYKRVSHHTLVEVVELHCVGQLAVDQQKRHLQERGLLCQLLDGVAAIAQYAL